MDKIVLLWVHLLQYQAVFGIVLSSLFLLVCATAFYIIHKDNERRKNDLIKVVEDLSKIIDDRRS